MRHVIVLLILAGLAWHGYGKYQQSVAKLHAPQETIETLSSDRPSTRPERPTAPDNSQNAVASLPGKNFQCDGRQHCSQMTSCEEANWFLRHCPGVKMDGDNDGQPCERGPC
ncbi:MAG: excalibur calcium-binding domain-containing protein [Rhodocyclaceae bacterium]|nr:MAG: excalibur calcium-binding domain-containing protein [Rhodocyclaceae bacterium]